MGWDEGPIPWLAVDRYADVKGFEGEQRDDLFFFVTTLDRAYLKWRRAQNSKGSTK